MIRREGKTEGKQTVIRDECEKRFTLKALNALLI